VVQSQDVIAKQVALFRLAKTVEATNLVSCSEHALRADADVLPELELWRTNPRELGAATGACTSTQAEQAGPPGMREARSRGPEEILTHGCRGATWAVWTFGRRPVTRVVVQVIVQAIILGLHFRLATCVSQSRWRIDGMKISK
jgi:hypothetical protein